VVRGLRLPQIGGFPLTLNVALTTVLRTDVLRGDGKWDAESWEPLNYHVMIMREYVNMVSHLTCGMSSLHSVNLILVTLLAGSPYPAHITSSHAHTVVWECCKDDRQCQWRITRFDPQPTLNPEPIITKFETRDYVGDIFFQNFFGSIRPGDFVPPYTRNIHSKPSNVYFTFSVLPSPNREGRWTDFRA